MAGACTAAGPRITVEQQAAAVIREIGMRERVYPNWVTAKKMSQEKADHELAAMRAVLVTVNDYIAMQPKVLALGAAAVTLAKRLGMDQEQLDALLVEAEIDARERIEKSKG